MNYKPKTKQAPWTRAFPDQVSVLVKATKERKPRKRIKTASDVMIRRLLEYAKAKAKYLARTPICERCKSANPLDIHHLRGRTGELLTDESHFVALCRKCHSWVHDNPREARSTAWLAGPGEWGRQ